MSYPDFYNSIPLTFETIQQCLTQGVSDRNSHFRTMNLSYINQNMPFCRTVVLREYDADLAYLQYHTDYRSPKIQALSENNNVAVHFYDSQSKIQMSMNGLAIIHHKDDIAENAWQKTQILSRRCYLSQYAPTTLVSEPHNGFDEKFKGNTQTYADTHIGYDNFSVVRIMIKTIDWLYLHMHGNRRIIFTNDTTGFNGQWCIP